MQLRGSLPLTSRRALVPACNALACHSVPPLTTLASCSILVSELASPILLSCPSPSRLRPLAFRRSASGGRTIRRRAGCRPRNLFVVTLLLCLSLSPCLCSDVCLSPCSSPRPALSSRPRLTRPTWRRASTASSASTVGRRATTRCESSLPIVHLSPEHTLIDPTFPSTSVPSTTSGRRNVRSSRRSSTCFPPPPARRAPRLQLLPPRPTTRRTTLR